MEDLKNEARVLYEAHKRAGFSSDPDAVMRQIEQLQRGLPAEDEFAALCVWSGRCTLTHALDQAQWPEASKDDFQVPDLLVLFEVDGQPVPMLIEVKSTNGDRLQFAKNYRARLARYASVIGLPLLVAWRGKHGLWSLFDARAMSRGPQGAWRITFEDAMKQNLMGVLLGEIMISVRAGVGMTLRMREDERVSDTQRIVTVVDAFWHGPTGERVQDLDGRFLSILLCCPEGVESEQEGSIFTQRFFVQHSQLVLSHRAMIAPLLQEGAPNWPAVLRSGNLAGGGVALRSAALDAMHKGMVDMILDLKPQSIPDFLSAG